MAENTFINKVLAGVIQRIKKLFHRRYQKVGLSWLQVKELKHLSAGKERKIKMLNGWISYISPQELFHAVDEIFIDNIYGQQLKRDAYIIDCGANIGMSIIRLKMIAPDAIIDAFEPDEQNFALLKKNIGSFNFSNVALHKAAVWKEKTMLSFNAEGSMSSRIDEKVGIEKKVMQVEAVRLKDYLVKPVDFLKIDIEGAEYKVLQDISDGLQVVKTMFVEYHGGFNQNNELLEIFEIINNAGFVFYIKEAASVYDSPFMKKRRFPGEWDVQLNIFCIRN